MTNWIDLSQDADTGIESVRAHFTGHAYDPHWHDSYLVGATSKACSSSTAAAPAM